MTAPRRSGPYAGERCTTERPPRVRPGTRHDLGLPAWLFARAAGLVTGTEPPQLFLTLGRHRGLFLGWLHFAGRLMPGGTLPRRQSELVILRVAHLLGCRYEFDHHLRLGRRAGVTAADAARLCEGPDATGWSERERVLLTAADRLTRDGDLDDDTWDELRRHLDERTAVEFCLLVGHYTMLATVITTLRIPADHPRRGLLSRLTGSTRNRPLRCGAGEHHPRRQR